MVGLPPGDFALPIFDVVLNAKTVRGSIVGSRQDLNEALQFAADGIVHASTTSHRLDDINRVFDDLRHGRVDGRAVLDFS
jgi:propanol-preferring alcohol dehydrogenase